MAFLDGWRSIPGKFITVRTLTMYLPMLVPSNTVSYHPCGIAVAPPVRSTPYGLRPDIRSQSIPHGSGVIDQVPHQESSMGNDDVVVDADSMRSLVTAERVRAFCNEQPWGKAGLILVKSITWWASVVGMQVV